MNNKEEQSTEKFSASTIDALNSAPVGEVIVTAEQMEHDKFEEWLKSRSGLITGSNFGKLDVQPKLKAEKEAGELGQTAKSYLNLIIAEKNGSPRKELDIYQFRHGNKYEPMLISELEEKLGIEIDFKGENQKCFKLNDLIGATPDGLFGKDFGVEGKCPVDGSKHIEHLKIKTVEEFKKKRKDYYWQCVGGMLVTGRTKWLFVSFFPFFEGDMRMSILVIERDEDEIAYLQGQLSKGKKYLNKTIAELGSNDISSTIQSIKNQL